MSRIDEAVINFQVFEGGTNYFGMSEATLPEVNYLVQEISGAGISGNMESIILGHVEAMTLVLNFRTVTRDAIALLEPREHELELRVAQQHKLSERARSEVIGLKHVFVAKPKSFKPGSLAPMTPADASGEYAIYYWKMSIAGRRTLEIDIRNMIYFINGRDYLDEVRAVLGRR